MDPQTFLQFLQSRHTVRAFTPEAIERSVLTRLLQAATTAPSATNRQPWRFTVVTSPSLKEELAEAVRAKVDAIETIAQRVERSDTRSAYWRYFHEPLRAAAALVVPQYRLHPDVLAGLIEAGGADPSQFVTAEAMQTELCAVNAATMALLLQAHAEGLGACWMTGPLVAREDLCRILSIEEPWRPLAVMALGHPAEEPRATARKPLSQVVHWLE